MFSIYIDYLYELLLMQNPLKEEDIQMMPIADVIRHIEAGNAKRPPTELRSCKQNSD